jgi:TolA-binding protein
VKYKNQKHTSHIISLICLALCSCSTSVRKDVVRLENSFDTFRKLHAEQLTQVDSINERIMSLEGRVEELEFKQKSLLGSEVSSLKDEVSSLKRRVPPPDIVPKEALLSAEDSARGLPEEISGLILKALAHIREGTFENSIPLLNAAFDQVAGKSFGAEILFWKGVSYEGLENQKEAILSYSQIVSLYTKSPLVPAALLRQAYVFKRLNDVKASTIALNKLINDFPNSQEAQSAKELPAVK